MYEEAMNDNRPAEPADFSDAHAQALAATGLSVSLTVADLRASAEWYRDVLGFVIEREFERGGVAFAVRLRTGAVALLITQENGARGAERAKGEGFSLQFTTRQRIDDIADRAKARGVVLDSEPADAWGARVFRLRDPDGFRLVISTERSQ
jgi:uncharacterized glyoxalase superfamily protein PhnB